MNTNKVFVAPLAVVSDVKYPDIFDRTLTLHPIRYALVYKNSKNKYCDLVTKDIYKGRCNLKTKLGDIVIGYWLLKININEVENSTYKKHMSRKHILDSCNNGEFYNKAIEKIKVLSYEKR